MGYGNISYVMTPKLKEEIRLKLEGVKTGMPFLVNLTTEERIKLRKIGPQRLGYVTEVNRASNAHKAALAASFNLDEYNKDKTLLNDLAEIQSWLGPLHDTVVNTMIALGSEVMKQSDTAYDYLKLHALKNKDENLSSTIKKISAILKQTKKDDKEEKVKV